MALLNRNVEIYRDFEVGKEYLDYLKYENLHYVFTPVTYFIENLMMSNYVKKLYDIHKDKNFFATWKERVLAVVGKEADWQSVPYWNFFILEDWQSRIVKHYYSVIKNTVKDHFYDYILISREQPNLILSQNISNFKFLKNFVYEPLRSASERYI